MSILPSLTVNRNCLNAWHGYVKERSLLSGSVEYDRLVPDLLLCLCPLDPLLLLLFLRLLAELICCLSGDIPIDYLFLGSDDKICVDATPIDELPPNEACIKLFEG